MQNHFLVLVYQGHGCSRGALGLQTRAGAVCAVTNKRHFPLAAFLVCAHPGCKYVARSMFFSHHVPLDQGLSNAFFSVDHLKVAEGLGGPLNKRFFLFCKSKRTTRILISVVLSYMYRYFRSFRRLSANHLNEARGPGVVRGPQFETHCSRSYGRANEQERQRWCLSCVETCSCLYLQLFLH